MSETSKSVPAQTRGKRYRWLPLIVIVGYVLFICLQTFPLITQMSDHLPGPENLDQKIFLWNAWWFSYALEHHENLLGTHHMFAPEGVSLAFQSHTYVHDAVTFLLHRFLPLVLAHNITTLSFLVFAAYGVYLLAKKISGHTFGSFIAGALFISSSYVMHRLTGHLDLTAVWPLPWSFYCLLRVVEKRTLKAALLLGCVLGFSILNGFNYPAFIAIFIGASLLYFLFMMPFKEWFRILRLLLLSCCVVVLVSLPLITAYMQSYSLLLDVKQQGYAAWWKDYIIPSWLQTGYRSLVNVQDWLTMNLEKQIFVGLLPIVFCLAGLFVHYRSRKKYADIQNPMQRPAYWVGWIFTALIFSFGYVVFFGHYIFPLPLYFITAIPLLNGIRIPSRFSIVLELGMVMLTAFSFRWMQDAIHWKRKWTVWAVLIVCGMLLLAESATFPYITTEVPPYQVSEAFRTAPGSVINIPEIVRDGTFTHTPTVYGDLYAFQTVHEKPVVGGYLSRIDPDLMERRAETPGLDRFFFPQSLTKEIGAEELEVMKQAFVTLDIGAVAIFPDQLTPSQLKGAERLMQALHAEQIQSDQWVVVYQVPR